MSSVLADSTFRPVKVGVIDVEQCPESIDGAPGYAALWAVVRERGRPRGMIKLPFNGTALSRDELEEAIAALPEVASNELVDRQPEQRLPKISVVIPTLIEREELLRACLRSLAALDYPDYEVIVVDNRRAGAPHVELAGVRAVHEPRPGLSAARNRGLAEAEGEIVAFTDDDVEVDAGWLRAVGLRLRDHPEEVCVTGLVIPRELETPAQVALEQYYDGFGPRSFEPVSHRLRRRPALRSAVCPATVDAIAGDGRVVESFSIYAAGNFGIGANMSFRAAALRELGGFSLALGPGTPTRNGEELELFARLAWRGDCLGFEPAALVRHTHRRELASLRKQIHNYGIGYTALLTSLVVRDPRHVGRMLGTVPGLVRALSGGYQRKRASERSDPSGQQPSSRTSELLRLELRGFAAGPSAYLHSRRVGPA